MGKAKCAALHIGQWMVNRLIILLPHRQVYHFAFDECFLELSRIWPNNDQQIILQGGANSPLNVIFLVWTLNKTLTGRIIKLRAWKMCVYGLYREAHIVYGYSEFITNWVSNLSKAKTFIIHKPENMVLMVANEQRERKKTAKNCGSPKWMVSDGFWTNSVNLSSVHCSLLVGLTACPQFSGYVTFFCLEKP